LRHARALPYELDVRGSLSQGELTLNFENTGSAGACFQVRSGALGPWSYTVESGKSLSDTWNAARAGGLNYDLSVFGPNGFLRGFRGSLSGNTNLDVDVRYDPDHLEVELRVTNRAAATARVSVANAYGGKGHDDDQTRRLRQGQSLDARFSLRDSFGWYDISVTTEGDSGFLRRLAGHLENGDDSASDPAFGAVRTRGERVES
jgi:phospholipase C